MDQLTLGVGTRLQHTLHGPGVIVGVKYATYIISFIDHGIKEIDKDDQKLEEIIPENVTVEIETSSATEQSLLKILKLWGGITESVPLGDKWLGGTMSLQAADKTLKPKEIPIEDFFHKVVMLRDRLRVLEQNINSHKKLNDEDKVNIQQYITRVTDRLQPLMFCSKTRSSILWAKVGQRRLVIKKGFHSESLFNCYQLILSMTFPAIYPPMVYRLTVRIFV